MLRRRLPAGASVSLDVNDAKELHAKRRTAMGKIAKLVSENKEELSSLKTSHVIVRWGRCMA